MKYRFLPWLVLLMMWGMGGERAYSNGGPLDEYSINMTGKHEFKNVESIQLDWETLNIQILGDEVEYHVTYELLNQGEAVTVQYGFPIEITVASGTDPKKVDAKFALKSFELLDQNKAVPCSLSVEKRPIKNEEDEDWVVCTIWNRAQITFSPHEKKTLQINYRVKSANDDMIFTKSFKPEYSPRKANYAFDGAKYWGNGKAGKVTIQIGDQALLGMGGKILSVTPSDYEKDDKGYHKVYTDVAIGKIPRLMITYDNEPAAFSEYVENGRIPRSAIVKIQASSTLPDAQEGQISYKVDNLLDSNPETAWVEGKGAGVTLEIWLKGYAVDAVGILNGYTKSEAAFEENAEPSVVRVQMPTNGEEGDNDRPVTLAPRKFKDFNPKQIPDFVDWIGDYGDAYKETKYIKIIIDKTHPGTKYTDTAISELYLLGYKYSKENEGN